MMTIKEKVLKALTGNSRPYNSPNGSILEFLRIKVDVIRGFLLTLLIEFQVPRSGLKNLLELKATRTNAIVLVVGNGPSANHLNFDEISQTRRTTPIEVICVNFAFNVMPELIAICDFLVLSDEICRVDSDDPRSSRLWKILESNSHIKVVTPLAWHNDILISCKNNSCFHFSDKSLEGITSNIDLRKPRGYPSMTSYKALAIAAYLEYSSIYIIGFDNSLFRSVSTDEENRIFQSDNHAGKSNYQDSRNVSGFYPSGIGDYFYDVSYLFLSLRRCFSNLPVTNLDKHSLVDAFSKKIVDPKIQDMIKPPA
jgi:hypothetical protein